MTGPRRTLGALNPTFPVRSERCGPFVQFNTAAVMSWFRLYDDVVDDPKVQKLSPLLFRAWINCLCIAKKNNGALPEIRDVAYRLHITEMRAEALVKELVTSGLFELDGSSFIPHNWHGRQFQSDGGKKDGKYVYLIKDEDARLVKIGFSKNPWARVMDIRSEHGNKNLKVIATYRSMSTSEVDLHVVLSEFHHEREWFELPDGLLNLMLNEADAHTTYEDLVALLRSKCSSSDGLSTTTQRQITETEQKRIPKLAFGQFENVKLSGEEKAKLDSLFGPIGSGERIESLSVYIASKGRKYKDHYATILSWERKNGSNGYTLKPGNQPIYRG